MPPSFPTETLTHQLEDCQGCQVGCRGSVRQQCSGFQHNTSRHISHPDLTAVYSSLGNFVSLTCGIDGVRMVMACNSAGRQFVTRCTATTEGRIMLIIELLSVLTHGNNPVCAYIYTHTHTFLRLHPLYFMFPPIKNYFVCVQGRKGKP